MQKSLSQIITSVASELGTPPPTTVISSQNEKFQQLLAFARAVNDDLLAEFDWQALQTRYSFTTSNGVDQYSWPTDVERWISGTFWDQTNRWEMQGPRTPRQWEWLKSTNLSAGPFERFRISGDRINLYPVPGTTPYTFNCEYITNNVVLDGSTGLPKADYTQDSDLCRFDPRMVICGIKLKFLESKGGDTTSALTAYRRAVEFAKGSDSPRPILSMLQGGIYPMLSNANLPDASWH